MGAWSLYFFAKLAMYYNRVIGLHWLANLVFAALLAWPVSRVGWRRLRLALAVPAALALLYWDSYLPPWTRLLTQAGALSDFRADYLLELARRFVSIYWLLAFVALAVLYWFLAHRVRFATWVFLGLVAAAMLPAPKAPAPTAPAEDLYVRVGEAPPTAAADAAAGSTPLSPAQLDAALSAYLGREHGKTVSFARTGTPKFDLILLSVCSLSNDDLAFEHLQDDPLLARFDIVFHRFNSAATYSGPAVLRLLHGTCGQTAQRELYSGTATDDCYLFRNLAAAGYHPALLLNHDGQFDHFAQQLRMQGGIGADPLDNHGAPVVMTAFDDSPIRSDFDLLSQWWRQHAQDETHNVLLYNTITLHDGTRAPGMSSNSLESYAPRLHRLFSDLGRFLDLVEATGRPTVVVLIPEHGAALRGDAVQVSGLRELPTPGITTVPAAVKLIGFASVPHGPKPLVVEQTSSYLTLTALIAGLAQSGPAGTSPASLQGLLRALPSVQWVAENENTVLMRQGARAYLRYPNGQWSEFGTAADR
jgi:cellulose synthase operon protein YhjU